MSNPGMSSTQRFAKDFQPMLTPSARINNQFRTYDSNI